MKLPLYKCEKGLDEIMLISFGKGHRFERYTILQYDSQNQKRDILLPVKLKKESRINMSWK